MELNAVDQLTSFREWILPDGGHAYAETNINNIFVEPWNAVTALIFFFIAVFWLIRLRNRYEKYKFLAVSMGILVVGGLGGALFHGFRTSNFFLLMDVVPIYGLAIATAVWLWFRIVPSWKWIVPIMGTFLVNELLLLPALDLTQTAYNSLSYLNLGGTLMFPLIAVMVKTKFRYYQFVVAAIVFFAAALTFRIVDWDFAPNISIGTHFLWHVFGAISCALMAEYMYRLMSLRMRAIRLRVRFDRPIFKWMSRSRKKDA